MKYLLNTAAILALAPFAAAAQSSFDLGEIVVTATAEPTEAARTGASIDTLGAGDLAGRESQTVADVLADLPGITLSQNGPAGTSADLRLRGSTERYIAVYIDGIKVNDPSATTGQFGSFGTLTAGAIDHLEVLKGSQSALYGASAVAGVVNMFSLPDAADVPEGVTQTVSAMAGSFGTFSAGYGLTQRTGALTLRLGLSHLKSSGFSAAEENDGNGEADGMRETRLSFGAEYALTDRVIVGLNGFASEGTSEFDEYAAAPADGTPDETAGTDTSALRLYTRVEAAGWTHDLAVSTYRIDRRLDSPTVSAETLANFGSPFSSRFHGTRTRLDYAASGRIGDAVQLTLGIDAQQEKAEYDYLAAGSETVDTYGAFAEAVYSPNADLDIIGTLRMDDHSSFGGVTTGRLAFSYRPRQGVVLRGAVAKGYRAPSIDELYGDYSAFFFVGNPDLTPETSLTYELGADVELAGGTQLGATVFRTEIDDLIGYTAGFDSLENKPGTSVRQGVELSGRHALTDKVTLTGAYTYVDATDASGARLVRTPQNALTLGLEASLGDRLTATATLNHVSDRIDRSITLEPYTVLNVGATYALTDRSEAYLQINNLTDEQYQTVPGYGTADRAIYVGYRASF